MTNPNENERGTGWLRLNVTTDNERTQMTSVSDFNDYTSTSVWREGAIVNDENEEPHTHQFQTARHCATKFYSLTFLSITPWEDQSNKRLRTRRYRKPHKSAKFVYWFSLTLLSKRILIMRYEES